MKAWVIHRLAPLAEQPEPLRLVELPVPEPGPDELLLRVTRCGVCHTELDEIEGRTPPPVLPVVPGHQVVGRVERLGSAVSGWTPGQRAGVAWIAAACGTCAFCRSGRENLCPSFRATGRDIHGGYAEYMTLRADFAHPIPDALSDAAVAPLLCAGAVGYRALKLCQLLDGQALGLMGFGGSNHLVLKAARHVFPHSDIFVFSRNPEERALARSLGAAWTGAIDEAPPQALDAIIDTTPVWTPDMEALKRLKPGGRLVINNIRKEDVDKASLLNLDYATHLWLEKEVKSVANVTRADVREFLSIAAALHLQPEFQEYAFEEANRALLELRHGKIRGAKVLRIADL